jgi:hypothetical protein
VDTVGNLPTESTGTSDAGMWCEAIAMIDDQRALAAELMKLADRVRQLETSGDVVDQILNGALLSLEQAADVCECSDEKIRRACEAAAATKHPLGVRWAGRWLLGKARLLDMIERGKLDGRRGKHARLIAEGRAGKYESWARPQTPLKVPDRAEG